MPNNSLLSLLEEAGIYPGGKLLDPRRHANKITPTRVINPGEPGNGGPDGSPLVVGSNDCYIGVLTQNNLTCEITLPHPDNAPTGQFFYISDIAGLADVGAIIIRVAGLDGQNVAQDRIMGGESHTLNNKWESIGLICITRGYANGVADRMWVRL